MIFSAGDKSWEVSERTFTLLNELQKRPDLKEDSDRLIEWSRTAMKGMTFDEWLICNSIICYISPGMRRPRPPMIMTNAKL